MSNHYHKGPPYDRKSYPTKYNGILYASFSEAECAKALTQEHLAFTYSHQFTWNTSKKKVATYSPDFTFKHPITPTLIPWPIQIIEVKGVIHDGSIYKLRSMNHFHKKMGIFASIEIFQYWQHYSMFDPQPRNLTPKRNNSRLKLRQVLFQALQRRNLKYEKEVPLNYHRKNCIVDIKFPYATHLPGIIVPVDYLYVIDHWTDILPIMVWIQGILQKRQGKTLFFVTRNYIDLWRSESYT